MAKFLSNIACADPYGNCGATPDASWVEQWMRFSPSMRDEYLKNIAHSGPLGLIQLECLIQGLLPPPTGWLPTCTCVEESYPLIKRLRQDMERGALANAPTANEFAAWCDQMGVTLPDPLVKEIQKIAGISTLRVAPPQSTVVIVVPAWVPITLKKINPSVEKKSRGQPRTGAAKYEVLVRDGIAKMMSEARAGRKITIPEIAKFLRHTPCGEGMKINSIERRLKGKLPVAQAQATATKYLHSKPFASR